MPLSPETQIWLRDATSPEMKDQLYSLGFRESSNGRGDNGQALPVTYVDEMSDDVLYDKLVEYYEQHPEETPVLRWDDNGGYRSE